MEEVDPHLMSPPSPKKKEEKRKRQESRPLEHMRGSVPRALLFLLLLHFADRCIRSSDFG